MATAALGNAPNVSSAPPSDVESHAQWRGAPSTLLGLSVTMRPSTLGYAGGWPTPLPF